MQIDGPLLSAFAALIAASVALYVGFRNSEAAHKTARAALMNAENAGRHRVAAFRQEWINSVIDSLTTYQSIEATRDPNGAVPKEEARQMAALRAKLEILLNPNETDTVDLLAEMDRMQASTDGDERKAHEAEIVRVSRQLLKREWARIKTELT